MKKQHEHAPKFYVRLCKGKSTNFPNNFTVYPGSIYGRFRDENGNQVFWVCDSYLIEKGKLPVHIFNGSYWKLCTVDSDHRCYKYVKKAIETIGRVPKVQTENITFDDCENMMKTYSRHKKGNGSRINNNQINNPLRWNEVTVEAHWFGKGNASVVANGIR